MDDFLDYWLGRCMLLLCALLLICAVAALTLAIGGAIYSACTGGLELHRPCGHCTIPTAEEPCSR